MYLGNEIKISSGKLPYYLYESNWMEQSGRCKRLVIVLAEVLKRHQVIMVAKLYALSLETFNAVRMCVCGRYCLFTYWLKQFFIQIMRTAYSMFNLLNNM